MNKKRKVFSIFALFAVVLQSIVVGLIFPSSVGAVTSDEMVENTRKWSIYTAFRNCAVDSRKLEKSVNGTYNSVDVSKFNRYDWQTASVGFIAGSGKTSCGDIVSLATAELKKEGKVQDEVDFIKKLGYTFNNQDNTWSVSDLTELVKRFDNLASAGLTKQPYMDYLLYRAALTHGSGCKSTAITNPAEAAAYRSNTKDYFIMGSLTDSKGAPEESLYKKGDNWTKPGTVSGAPYTPTNNTSFAAIPGSQNVTCYKMTENVGTQGSSFRQLTSWVQGQHEATVKKPITDFCYNAYRGSGALAESCISTIYSSYKSCSAAKRTPSNIPGAGDEYVAPSQAEILACMARNPEVMKHPGMNPEALQRLLESVQKAEQLSSLNFGSIDNQTSTQSGDVKPVCAGGILGWALCPILTIVTEALKTFTDMIDKYMRFDPLMGTSQGEAVYVVWRMVVGMANLALVAAFLVVIFSQATSVGLSAYGIKKMLPRIIAAAILINISFYLCAILVDVFNIIGASVSGIIGAAHSAIPDGGAIAGKDAFSGVSGFAAWILTIQGGFAAIFIASVTGTIGYVVPFILAILLAVFVIFLVLAVRHALALLLVMISPLAFAAMILPGTNGLFKKWWKALVTILALYPVIMALSYGSMLVSKIMLTTIEDDPNSPAGAFMVLIAYFVNVAWIFALKFIVTWGAGFIGKIAGMVNDKSKGLIDRSRNWATEKKDRSGFQSMRKMNKNAANTAAQRRAIERYSKGGLGASLGGKGFLSTVSGGRLVGTYGKQGQELLGAQAEKALAGIQKEQREMIMEHTNRPTVDIIGRGFRLNDDGSTFHHISDTSLRLSRDETAARAGVSPVAMDDSVMSNLRYFRDNNVMGSTNGIKAMTERAFQTGSMDSAMLGDLTEQVAKQDRGDFVEFLNQSAMREGYVHMGFTSLDNAGKPVVGGRLADPGAPAGDMRLVAEKMLKSFGSVSKDVWADKDNEKWAEAVHAHITDLARNNTEVFRSELAKMDSQQAVKFLGIMNAHQQRVSGSDWMSEAAFNTERDSARKDYSKA